LIESQSKAQQIHIWSSQPYKKQRKKEEQTKVNQIKELFLQENSNQHEIHIHLKKQARIIILVIKNEKFLKQRQKNIFLTFQLPTFKNSSMLLRLSTGNVKCWLQKNKKIITHSKMKQSSSLC